MTIQLPKPTTAREMKAIHQLLALVTTLNDNQRYDNPAASEEEDFHQHLDRCRQCADHPFALCVTGERLIKREAASLNKPTTGRTKP